MLKRSRARFHEQFADWLAAHEADRFGEVEEVIGYHLEQAYAYLIGLGPLDDHGRGVRDRAASLLIQSGRRAFAREDMHAAVGLLGRGIDLQPDDSADRRAAQLLLSEALDEVGDYSAAEALLDEVRAGATSAGDEASAARARLLRLRVELSLSPPADWAAAALAEAERDLPIFEAGGDLGGVTLAWRVRYLVHATIGLVAEAASDAEQVISLSSQAGDERQRLRGISNLALALTYGPAPAAEACDRLETLLGEIGGDRRTGVVLKAAIAQLRAMAQDFDGARSAYREARETAHELGQPMLVAQLALDAGEVELRAGDPAVAEALLIDAAAVFAGVGDTYYLASVSSLLGRALVELGRIRDASAEAARAADLAAEDDLDAQSRWRGLRSLVLLAEGDYPAAVARAEEAVALARAADSPLVTALALSDLAAVLRASGDEPRAREAHEEALAIYTSKGDVASAERLRVVIPSP
jgi:tetratricopeptide (TPR) repeat protein